MKHAIISDVIGISDDGHSYEEDVVELQFVYHPDEDVVYIILDGNPIGKADWSFNIKIFCENCLRLFMQEG